ncbi:MAG: hypothetical protein GY899_08945 [Verrucomicrobiaceae bacterium]|nr:hypothetical protein [Verrucomicrobiaceae bacterium]
MIRTTAISIFFLTGSLLHAGFEIKEMPSRHIDILNDGKVMARVMTAHDTASKESRHETYKVYTHVFDEAGKAPITKGAGGQFTHHRGIFLGWSKTRFDGKQVDSWHMKGCDQVYQKIIKKETGEGSATLTILIHWVTDDGVVFIEEERTQVFRRTEGAGAYLQVDVDTSLKAPAAEVELNGDPEHAGCQFRPSNEVSKNKSAKYVFHKDGLNLKKDKDLPWAALSFNLGDKAYFAQHMSHPSIPKGNTYSAYRDYGRFGAYFVKKIPKGDSLQLRYSYLVGAGEMPKRSYFSERYREFAK